MLCNSLGACISHLENLAQTDLQALKRAEIAGYTKKWIDAIYVVNMSIYLNILSPIRRTSAAMQQEIHNPVKVTGRIK